MPVRLREFYWNELIESKETERGIVENVNKAPNKSTPTSKTIRR